MPPFGSTGAPAPGSAAATPGPCRVLYVEDDRVTSLLFAEALRREPRLALRVAESPDEALALVRHWPPQVLVVDAQLPGMSGHELLPLLRALPGMAEVPAFMCSADNDAAALTRALASGFQGYWPKPVPTVELLQRLLAVADNTGR